MGKMFIGVLGLMVEFESDLIRSRTRDAAAVAGKMKGRQHKLTPEECAYLLQTYGTGQFKIETLCRNTVSRIPLWFAFCMKCGRPGVRAGAIRRGPRCGR